MGEKPPTASALPERPHSSKSPAAVGALKYYHVGAVVAGRDALLLHQVDLTSASPARHPGLHFAGRHNKEIGAKRWLHVQSS